MAYEIDFLAVGDGARSGDAIAMRYSDGHSYRIHVIDGGDQAAGVQMVKHIRMHYENPSYIDAVTCTHGDDNRSSGLREVIKAFKIGSIWMNRPWLYARLIIDAFNDKRMTIASLERHLREEYPILAEIEALAEERGIPIHAVFQGDAVGPVTIVAPSKERYIRLIPEFSRTPEQAASDPFNSSGWTNLFARAAQSVRGAADWVAETWGLETLEENVETTASNESSVVQLAQLDGERILLTGDAGVIALREAADFTEDWVCDLPGIDFMQVPHHGSRHNVSPSSLDRWLGRCLPDRGSRGTVAYASVAKATKTHPRKKVVNAFIRRGAEFYATKGTTLWHRRGTPPRQGWKTVAALEFSERVEA